MRCRRICKAIFSSLYFRRATALHDCARVVTKAQSLVHNIIGTQRHPNESNKSTACERGAVHHVLILGREKCRICPIPFEVPLCAIHSTSISITRSCGNVISKLDYQFMKSRLAFKSNSIVARIMNNSDMEVVLYVISRQDKNAWMLFPAVSDKVMSVESRKCKRKPSSSSALP